MDVVATRELLLGRAVNGPSSDLRMRTRPALEDPTAHLETTLTRKDPLYVRR